MHALLPRPRSGSRARHSAERPPTVVGVTAERRPRQDRIRDHRLARYPRAPDTPGTPPLGEGQASTRRNPRVGPARATLTCCSSTPGGDRRDCASAGAARADSDPVAERASITYRLDRPGWVNATGSFRSPTASPSRGSATGQAEYLDRWGPIAIAADPGLGPSAFGQGPADPDGRPLRQPAVLVPAHLQRRLGVVHAQLARSRPGLHRWHGGDRCLQPLLLDRPASRHRLHDARRASRPGGGDAGQRRAQLPQGERAASHRPWRPRCLLRLHRCLRPVAAGAP